MKIIKDFGKLLMLIWLLILIGLLNPNVQAQIMKTPHELDTNYSADYSEVINYYTLMDQLYAHIDLRTWGSTDFGEPLTTVVLSTDITFDPQSARKAGKTILLINNGIHPGEPCGVDASMAFARNLSNGSYTELDWSNLVIVIIPMYNIGGSINRSSTSRANQVGPTHYGFRGNSKNYDLNRDFIKCDSKNAQTFNQIFSYWSPDIMVDTHTSNGADYTYTMTLISTQKDKLERPLHDLLERSMEPYLYASMKVKNWEMIPYVYAKGTPDNGIISFLDYPRYSSGYAALHHTISFMPETHMLKPFKDRVESTYQFLLTMVEYLSVHGAKVRAARNESIQISRAATDQAINWKLDTINKEKLLFKGYTATYKPSDVSGLDRLYYDHSQPYEKEIDYFKSYNVSHEINKPAGYIVPQGYTDVLDRLQWNGVEMHELTRNQDIEVELYRITDMETSSHPYEGHYLHSDVKTERLNKTWPFFKGDFFIPIDQPAARYVVETLEPEAPDAFFAWNFFDGIMMQKEYFSPYVFEDLAAELLAHNPELKKQLIERQEADEAFRNDATAQLRFVYEHSAYYERTHRMYPVARVLKLGQIKIND